MSAHSFYVSFSKSYCRAIFVVQEGERNEHDSLVGLPLIA